MTDPDGRVTRYERPVEDQSQGIYYTYTLARVVFPDETPSDPTDNPDRTYIYEEYDYPYALTGIIDENGDRFATYGYDADGWANLSEHAGGAGHHTFVYDKVTGIHRVTTPLGEQLDYHFQDIGGQARVVQIDRLASPSYPAASQTWTYDANGYPASKTDYEGVTTRYVYDAEGQQTSRTEAEGTAEERVITTQWHPTYRRPAQVVRPGVTTDFTYDANGLLLTRTETDTTSQSVPYSTNGETRGWTYTYTVDGLLETIDGPLTAVTDVTTFAYDAAGNLISVTDPVSLVTQLSEHDGRGLPGKLTDANGVETALAYTQRGWLAGRTLLDDGGDAATLIEYGDAGQVTRMVLPDGSAFDYEYDAAHRLTAVANDLGERIEYTLDAAGNRTKTDVKSDKGTILRTQSAVFDEIGRLLQSVGAVGQTTDFAYDSTGSVTSITDDNAGVTLQAFDGLYRLVSATDAASGLVDYGYDARDNLVSVTDQESLATAYVYDGFGDTIQVASPDSGTAVHEYDAAGNLVRTTDARGVVTDNTYDAASRITSKSFPATPAEDVTFGYDDITGGNYGLGRLTSITDQSGTAALVYDHQGNVTQEDRTIGAVAYTTRYAYDPAGKLTSVTYPSGRIVSYQRDSLGRVTTVQSQADADAPPVTVADQISYLPFGAVGSLTFANGQLLTYRYDQDYRVTGIEVDDGVTIVQDLTLAYDGVGNITAITDLDDPARDQSFGYDALDRLTTADGDYGALSYSYDGVGNRLTRVADAVQYDYSYDTVSHRLDSVTLPGDTRGFTYDTAGNMTADDRGAQADLTFSYNDANRLKQVTSGSPLLDFTYNALGQRVVKSDPGTGAAQHFHFDRAGRLLATSDGAGTSAEELIYLDGLLLARLTPEIGGGGGGTDVIVDDGDPGAVASGPWTASSAGSGFTGAGHQVSAQIAAGAVVVDNSDPTYFAAEGLWTSSIIGSGYEGSDYLERAYGETGQAVIVDDGDAEFTTYGTGWTLVSGTAGAPNGDDYLQHEPEGARIGSTVVDNPDLGYSETMPAGWANDTAEAGDAYGADYRSAIPNQPVPESVLFDNVDVEFSLTGAGWVLRSDGGDYEGGDYYGHPCCDPAAKAVWTPTIITSGQYHVFAKIPSPTSGSEGHYYYDVVHAGGTSSDILRWQPHGYWIWLGSYTFDPGAGHRIELPVDGFNGGSTALADAVQIVPTSAAPSKAVWDLDVAQTDSYNVYIRYADDYYGSYRTVDYEVGHDGGVASFTIDQRRGGRRWNLLGTFSLSPADGVGADPTASLLAPAANSTLWDSVTIQVDASDIEDPASTLAVDVSTDGGVSWNSAGYVSGTLFEYSWPTPSGEAGVFHRVVARSTDSDFNTTTSAPLDVTVDNVTTDPDDPDFASVELLLHMNGPDQSTLFTDDSGSAHTATAVGGAKLATVNTRFGGASVKLDGTGDYLTVPGGAARPWDLPGDFTLEGWMDADGAAGSDGVLSRSSSGSSRWVVYVNPTGTLSLYVTGVASGALLTSATDVRGAGWLHWAITREGSTWRLFIDGIEEDSATDSDSIASSTGTLYVGTDPASASARSFNGHLDDIRITVGVARYTADFDPNPATAVPSVSLLSPLANSTVSGILPVQVDASDLVDPDGTLTVDVSTDGGASWDPADYVSGTLFVYTWPTPGAEAGALHRIVARAANSAANTTTSGPLEVTVDNVATDPDDPDFDSVELLLHMNGPDQSILFTDDSGSAHGSTAVGDAELTTASRMFGSASGAFDGTGDYLSVPGGGSAPWDLPGDFTLEGWMDADATAGSDGLLGRNSSGNGRWVIYLYSTGELSFWAPGVISGVLLKSTTDVRGAGWLHWAITREGSTWRLFIDGVEEDSATDSDAIASSTGTLYVGTDPASLSARSFKGRLDDIRVTVGVARYTADFDPNPSGTGPTTSPSGPPEDPRVDLSDRAYTGSTGDLGTIAADAVMWVKPADDNPNTATWTPDLPRPDWYLVEGWWPFGVFAEDARFEIHSTSGVATTTADQGNNGSAWRWFGLYYMEPGQNHRVILSDLVPVGDTGGSDPGDFVADAVRFTPYASVERFATWNLPVATPDSYEVFAKWAPRADLASDATFHVYHDGGITDVVVDQTLGDGA